MKRLLPLLAIFALAYCASEDEKTEPIFEYKAGCTVPLADNYDPEAQIDDGSCHAITCATCTYTIPSAKVVIDGEVLNIKAGDVICLDAAASYKQLDFRKIIGTQDNPVIIVNCGGVVTLDASGLQYGIKTQNSKFFKIIGVGSGGSPYGIKVKGAQQGMQLQSLSTNFEISGLEIYNAGFAGIMAKTDPTCDDATIRGNFTMKDVAIHHNYVHDTQGEGLYIGNSFYADGRNVSPCGVRFPHEVQNVKIFQNIVKNTGLDGIQLGCATSGAEVYNNTIENFGVLETSAQWSGIQLGEGTGGLCYNNLIKNGAGQGIIALGLGKATIYNNLIVNSGKQGIFADLRGDGPFGPGYKLINNTIISPDDDGIEIYAKLVTSKNVVINNLIVDPGTYGSYGSNTGKAFINNGFPGDITNNYFGESVGDLKFKNAGSGDYRILETSPAYNAGRDVSAFGVTTDFLGIARPAAGAFDIGAFEL
jgi:hypothetical protein